MQLGKTHSLAHRYGSNFRIFGRAHFDRSKGEFRGAMVPACCWIRDVWRNFCGGVAGRVWMTDARSELRARRHHDRRSAAVVTNALTSAIVSKEEE